MEVRDHSIGPPAIRTCRRSVSASSGLPQGIVPRTVCDVVFSFGLIEHFGPADTREAALAHYRLLRPGGILIISFPTPMLLYRAARALFELMGAWKFSDERALSRWEVRATIEEEATVLLEKTMWPFILTQHNDCCSAEFVKLPNRLKKGIPNSA